MTVISSVSIVHNLTYQEANAEYKKQIASMRATGNMGSYVVWYDEKGDVWLQTEL